MICLIQRVTHGNVMVGSEEIGAIGAGLVVLTAFQPDDNSEKINKMVHKLMNYRVFSDEDEKMNLNVKQASGSLLLVPQFTLAADTKSGLRPSFSTSAPPAQAALWFDEFVDKIQQKCSRVATGKFGADMQVTLCNDGPVTFWLET